MSRYELTLSPDYVKSWTIYDAVREIFQNAKDQEITNEDNTMFFNYKADEQKLYIGNKLSVLEAKTLLLGNSTKQDDKNTIGQFGEGYKVAALILCREGKGLTFYNYGAREVWIPKIIKSRKFNSPLLVFDVDRKFIFQSVPDNNLTIVIEGITEKEYAEIVNRTLFLHDDIGVVRQTGKGTILKDPKYKGKVFVGGLYVTTYEPYEFGYNFNPGTLKLDRDRKLVSDWDLQWLSSEMWTDCDKEELVDLIARNSPDVAKVQAHLEWDYSPKPDKIKDTAYDKFKEEHGENAVPVVTQNDLAIYSAIPDVKPVIVPPTYNNVIRQSVKYTEPEAITNNKTPKEELQDWFKDVKRKLNWKDIEKFNNIFERLDG